MEGKVGSSATRSPLLIVRIERGHGKVDYSCLRTPRTCELGEWYQIAEKRARQLADCSIGATGNTPIIFLIN